MIDFQFGRKPQFCRRRTSFSLPIKHTGRHKHCKFMSKAEGAAIMTKDDCDISLYQYNLMHLVINLFFLSTLDGPNFTILWYSRFKGEWNHPSLSLGIMVFSFLPPSSRLDALLGALTWCSTAPAFPETENPCVLGIRWKYAPLFFLERCHCTISMALEGRIKSHILWQPLCRK